MKIYRAIGITALAFSVASPAALAQGKAKGAAKGRARAQAQQLQTQNQQLTTLANDETDSLTTNLDRTADTGNDVQQQSVAARQLATPQQSTGVTTETTAKEDDTKTDPPVADTPDATPPAAKTPDADTASTPSVTIPSRSKGRNPIGADRPKLNHPAPAIKRAFTKPDKRDATDGDDTSQDATKTGDSDKPAA